VFNTIFPRGFVYREKKVKVERVQKVETFFFGRKKVSLRNYESEKKEVFFPATKAPTQSITYFFVKHSRSKFCRHCS